MQWFLERISTKFYPVTFGYVYKKNYGKDFDILTGYNLITHSSNLNEIDCDLCDESHTTQIRQDGSKLFIVCEKGGGLRHIQSAELAIYAYQPTQLLSLFQSSLGISSPKVIENIPGLLWNFGSQEIDGGSYQLFFTNDIDKIDSGNLSIITAFPNSILFYTGIPHRTLPQKIFTIPLLDTFKGITKKGLLIDKEKILSYIRSSTRSVLFEDGDLYIKGEKLGHISIGTPDFYFIEILWKNFSRPVSHEEILTYCKQKLGRKDYVDTAQKFCNKRMTSIRKAIGDKEKVDSIFKTEKTEKRLNGYKMRSCE